MARQGENRKEKTKSKPTWLLSPQSLHIWSEHGHRNPRDSLGARLSFALKTERLFPPLNKSPSPVSLRELCFSFASSRSLDPPIAQFNALDNASEPLGDLGNVDCCVSSLDFPIQPVRVGGPITCFNAGVSCCSNPILFSLQFFLLVL